MQDTAIGENDARQEQRINEKEEQRFKEKEQRFEEEVDWVEYFLSIKKLCPWSLKFWMEDKILHITTEGGCEFTWCACFDASEYEAILFEYPHETTIDTLCTIVEKIEEKYTGLIAFWSHPDEKQNNTPKPCVIVQDRSTLTDLRKQVGYEDE
jgi:hypothetical protein